MKMNGLLWPFAKLAMRFAAIDIGTNTILMLIADVLSDGSLSIVADEHRIARLGKGVDAHGVIQPETFARVRATLTDLKAISDSKTSDSIVACGTSALRDASNRGEFLNYIKSHLGISIRILNGDEEAKLTYIGAISGLLRQSPRSHFAVLDIGGGSTEIVTGIGPTIAAALSFDIGSVRLTERILKKSPPDDAAIDEATHLVREQLRNTIPFRIATKLIGVAGTLTTLAAIDLKLMNFDRTKVDGHVLSATVIDALYHELKPLNLDELRAYPQIHPFRADILLAGTIILREALRAIGGSEIVVSDRGLRYGLIIETAENTIKNSGPIVPREK